jgi:hypothetical protein
MSPAMSISPAMSTSRYAPATAPTLYFIGVTTAKSSIMKVFPAWASALGLNGAVIKGIDFPLHADPAAYREAVEFIKSDPLSQGALVTTHKIDLYKACRDLFDEIDPHARFMEETSCLSKRGGKLVCHAKDPISSGLALDNFLPGRHFERTRLHDRAHVAPDAARAWRRPPLAHRRVEPQCPAPRRDPPHPRRDESCAAGGVCPGTLAGGE